MSPEELPAWRAFVASWPGISRGGITWPTDPSYVPPKPWEGPPVTPPPAAYGRLLGVVDEEDRTYVLRAVVELHGPKPWMVSTTA